MWESLEQEFLARFPRSRVNGRVNGAAGSPPPTDWDSCFAKLEEYRSCTGDWDGQGAILGKPASPILGNLIDSAVALMRSLRSRSVSAPNHIYPGVQGTVGFVWDLPNGTELELEVIDVRTADVFFYGPANGVEHLILTDAVNA